MKDNYKADVSHTDEFNRMYQEMVKQAEDKYKVKSEYQETEEEGLVEEETKPKFKVGDKIKLKSTLLNDIFGVIGYEPDGYRITNISNGLTYFMSYSIEHYYELVEESVNIDIAVEETTKDISDKVVDTLMGGLMVGKSFNLPQGYIFKDENGNVINATKIVLEKKGKGYPKTYEECCKVLNLPVRDLDILDNMLDTPEMVYRKNLDRLLNSFRKLLICRDAYWKIVGEEMGLGKPWEPSGNEDCFVISRSCGEVYLYSGGGDCEPFEFPTKEMRDAFKENFDPDIEICKELL